MSGDYMEHRSEDTQLSVSIERKIPLTWVIGGATAGAITLSVAFGSWAWNISLQLNNVSRDMATAVKTLEKVQQAQSEASTELNKGINRDDALLNRIGDHERRLTNIEARQALTK